MKNPLAALGRLLGRQSTGAVVTALYTNAIGRPLLVHGGMGESLIGAYLAGAVDAPAPVAAPAQEVTTGKAAIINVSGPLMSRPMPGLCDDGPVSYEAIRNAFDSAMADESITAIVFRIDSPGGMASGLFDLSDHIFASRGTKRIYAAIDDYAYSAACGLASACDEIWVTRTGQIGSVGAVYFNVNLTGADAKAGIKVTPIYSGAHKVDLNPHVPLSDDAVAKAQAQIDDLRDLFVDRVATYRGLTPEAVRATEADCYGGQAAIDIGLATHAGTFRDLLASIAAPPPATTDSQAQDGDNDADTQAAGTEAGSDLSGTEQGRAEATTAPPTDAPKTITEALAEAVKASALPAQVALAVLKTKAALTVESIPAFVESAQKIADLCAAAKLETLAADFVEQGMSVEVVQQKLVEAVASTGDELVTTPPAVTAAQQSNAKTNALDPSLIYANRKR